MSINGIEVHAADSASRHGRRRIGGVGTAGVLWALPSTASAASVNQTAAASVTRFAGRGRHADGNFGHKGARLPSFRSVQDPTAAHGVGEIVVGGFRH